MTHIQVTVNKNAGVAVARTLQGHGRPRSNNRSIFSRSNRTVIPLTA